VIGAILTLGISLGSLAAVFATLDAVALRPLAFPESGRLVSIGALVPGESELQEVSWPKLELLAAASHQLSSVAGGYRYDVAFNEGENPANLHAIRVNRDFFATWGIAAVRGRLFTHDEQAAGGPPVALVSAGFWRRGLGADPSIVGRAIRLDGIPTVVIGVLPQDLGFPLDNVEIWLPRPDVVSFMPQRFVDAGAGYLEVTGRLAPGATPQALDAELAALSSNYASERSGQLDVQYRLAARDLTTRLVGTARSSLLALFAGVGLVLLVACADLAGLFLADGLARRREVATRLALGASRREVLAGVVAQSLWITGLGGALGGLIAALAVRWLAAVAPAGLPRVDQLQFTARTWLVAFAAIVVAALLASIAPAAQALRSDPRRFLVESGRGAAGGRNSSRVQGALVALEIGLALVLLSASGLLLRSLVQVGETDLGFSGRNLVISQVSLADSAYPDLESRQRFFADLLARVRKLPGIESAAWVEYPPTVGAPHMKVSSVDGVPFAPEDQPLVLRALASDAYFATIGARVASGHDFGSRRAPSAAPTAILSRELARRLFGAGSSPLGHRVQLRGTETELEVVGVADDVQQNPLEQPREPMLWIEQGNAGNDLMPPNTLFLVMRSRSAVAAVAAELRTIVRQLDPAQPMPEMDSLHAMLGRATERRRYVASLAGGLAALAVGLAVLGIYGLLAHSLALRERELGIRAALGAGPARLRRAVVLEGLRWILPGLAGGLAASLAVARALASELYEVDPHAFGYFVLCASALGLASLAACRITARRASALDTARVLRAL